MRKRGGPLRDHWSEIDGMRLYARVSATPPPAGRLPVVLIHGHGVSSRYLVPTAERLAADHAVFAPDLPGFGRSHKPRHILSRREFTRILARWMDDVGIARAAILGNSFGCEVLVDFALRYPERVVCGVLQGPTPDPDARTAPQQILRLLLDAPLERVRLLPIVAVDYLRFGTRRLWENLFENILTDRIEEKLPRLRAPMLVVRGGRDPLVPQAWAERAARLLPRGRLVVVPGGSHALVFSHARELSRIVRVFLADPEGLTARGGAAPRASGVGPDPAPGPVDGSTDGTKEQDR